MTMRHAAGGAGQVDEPAAPPYGEQEPPGQAEPEEMGPDGGAAAAIKGTSLAGPTGGTIGAMADGSLGATVDPDPDRVAEPASEPDRS